MKHWTEDLDDNQMDELGSWTTGATTKDVRDALMVMADEVIELGWNMGLSRHERMTDSQVTGILDLLLAEIYG